jgi:hypothetical protein
MTKKPLPSLASVPVTAPAEPAPVTPAAPTIVPRESLHVRIPVQTAERVREAAFRLRRDKQDITDEALREWLARAGY